MCVFHKSILLIVQYKYLKICSKDFTLQDLILRTRLCGTDFIPRCGLVVDFHLTKMVRRKCFAPDLYQLRKGKTAGLALKYFYMIHRVGRTYSYICIYNIYVYMYTYIHIYIYIYIYILYIYIHKSIYINISIYVCVYINVYMYI